MQIRLDLRIVGLRQLRRTELTLDVMQVSYQFITIITL